MDTPYSTSGEIGKFYLYASTSIVLNESMEKYIYHLIEILKYSPT